MTEKVVSNKLKNWALSLNVLQIFTVFFFEVILFRLISYKNNLIFDYLPIKYLIIVQVILVILMIIPFVIKWNKKSTIASIVFSTIMIIALLTTGILGIVFDGQLKNMILKADQTLDKVVDNSQLSTDEYGVYVLKDDVAQSVKDIADYTFGYNSSYAAEDTNMAINGIADEIGKEINLTQYDDPAKLAQGLIDGKVKALILNQSMIDLIKTAGDDSDDEKSNGHYNDFTNKIKCLFTVNIKNELAKEKDSGNVTKDCFNVYLSGIDIEGAVTTKSRSDVNIIMSVNPTTHQILLISTPRDYYVPLSISNGAKDKLTRAGNYGIDVSIKTLEMLYGVNLDYYLRVNFTGFVNIIDSLGGIDVESEYAFSTHGYSYTKGTNENLSGIKALWFARERHSFAEGDKQRGKDQMEVIKSVIAKCQSTALLNNYNEILSDISESFQTNMNKANIKALVKFQLNKSPNWKIITYSVSGIGESNYTYSIPSARSYVMVPDESTIATAKQLLEDNKKGRKLTDPESTTVETTTNK